MPLLKQGAEPLPQFIKRNKDDRQCPSCGGHMSRRSKSCMDCRRARPEIEQPSDPTIRRIALTRGQVAIVSAHRYAFLMQWLWAAWRSTNTKAYYAVRTAYSKGVFTFIQMHRLIMEAPDGTTVDHENGDTLDNRDSNLRFATHAQQQQNRHYRRESASGFKGVALVRRKGREDRWRAEISVNGKRIIGGLTNDKEVARAEYKRLAQFHFGEFANFD